MRFVITSVSAARSVYFCYHANGELALLIYEVRNTFGGIHTYVLPVKRGDVNPAGIRQDRRWRLGGQGAQ